MSLPKFPSANITREEAISLILSSVAMEELGLSHIINAEGEKIQYVLGTLEGSDGPSEQPTIEDLIKINESVRDTLEQTNENNRVLSEKMNAALEASCMEGPPGKSAYEIALEHGFVGTEEEWLESLKGEDAHAELSINFNSVNTSRLQSGAAGQRTQICMVGLGQNNVPNSTSDPVTLTRPTFPIRLFEGGTVTELFTVFATEATLSTAAGLNIYAQLYHADTLSATTFFPVAGTLHLVGNIPPGSEAGVYHMGHIENLHFTFSDNSQFAIGFYAETDGASQSLSTYMYLSGVVKIKIG